MGLGPLLSLFIFFFSHIYFFFSLQPNTRIDRIHSTSSCHTYSLNLATLHCPDSYKSLKTFISSQPLDLGVIGLKHRIFEIQGSLNTKVSSLEHMHLLNPLQSNFLPHNKNEVSGYAENANIILKDDKKKVSSEKYIKRGCHVRQNLWISVYAHACTLYLRN